MLTVNHSMLTEPYGSHSVGGHCGNDSGAPVGQSMTPVVHLRVQVGHHHSLSPVPELLGVVHLEKNWTVRPSLCQT